MSKDCNCEDLIIITEGDAMHVAREVTCKKHGYRNSCYVCNPGAHTTERCGKCASSSTVFNALPFAKDPADTIDHAAADKALQVAVALLIELGNNQLSHEECKSRFYTPESECFNGAAATDKGCKECIERYCRSG